MNEWESVDRPAWETGEERILGQDMNWIDNETNLSWGDRDAKQEEVE
jgi:hypothetical protein